MSVPEAPRLVDGQGYGPVAKSLHWGTVVALVGQFAVGYLMVLGGDDLLAVHVALGATVLGLAVARVAWRRTHTLPPWAETLSPAERTFTHWNERLLLALLFVIPLSGLSLLVVDDDLLLLHVASHLTFFAALAAHVGLVLKHQLLDRDRLLRRML